MPRPRSEEKQAALLEAAIEMIAQQGLGASTAMIAKRAGVAEGTLFRYFPSKDDLFNALFIHLRRELHDAMMVGYDDAAELQHRARTVWQNYVNWGVTNADANRALGLLTDSDRIGQEARAEAAKLFPEIKGMREICTPDEVFADQPSGFADAIFMALASATVNFALDDPANRDAYEAAAFNVLWKGLTR